METRMLLFHQSNNRMVLEVMTSDNAILNTNQHCGVTHTPSMHRGNIPQPHSTNHAQHCRGAGFFCTRTNCCFKYASRGCGVPHSLRKCSKPLRQWHIQALPTIQLSNKQRLTVPYPVSSNNSTFKQTTIHRAISSLFQQFNFQTNNDSPCHIQSLPTIQLSNKQRLTVPYPVSSNNSTFKQTTIHRAISNLFQQFNFQTNNHSQCHIQSLPTIQLSNKQRFTVPYPVSSNNSTFKQTTIHRAISNLFQQFNFQTNNHSQCHIQSLPTIQLSNKQRFTVPYPISSNNSTFKQTTIHRAISSLFQQFNFQTNRKPSKSV